MNNNILDALIYTEIYNYISMSDDRYKKMLKRGNINDSGTDAQQQKIKDLLSNTTIKRAYCMGLSSKNDMDSGTYDPNKKAYKINVK